MGSVLFTATVHLVSRIRSCAALHGSDKVVYVNIADADIGSLKSLHIFLK